MIRSRQAGYTLWAMPWLPPTLGALIAVSAVAVRHGKSAALPLQIVAIALACGAASAIDDPAAATLAASPTSSLRRRARRLAIVLPPSCLLMVALLAWQGTAGSEEAWAIVAMFAGLLGLGLGIAGVATRRSPRGVVGAFVPLTLLVLLILSTMVPPRWRPLPIGDVPGGWTQIYLRWTAAGVVGLLVFLLSSLDPARRVPSIRG